MNALNDLRRVFGERLQPDEKRMVRCQRHAVNSTPVLWSDGFINGYQDWVEVEKPYAYVRVKYYPTVGFEISGRLNLQLQ